MTARIFKPSKSAMQSGRAQTREWRLEFEPEAPREIDPEMGWSGSTDTQAQVRLTFATKEEAIAFAEQNGIPYEVREDAGEPAPEKKAYADNFKFGRIGSWTH